MNTPFNLHFPFPPSELGNASVKMLIKDFIFDAYAEIRQAFTEAPVNEKLRFFVSILPYICMKQQTKERQGEWAPDNSMNTSWLQDAQKQRSIQQQKENAEKERDRSIIAFRRLVSSEEINYEKEFDRIACQVYLKILDDEFFANMKQRINDEEEFISNISEALFKVVVYELRRIGFEPPKPIHMMSKTVYPTCYLSDEQVQKIKQLAAESEQQTTTESSDIKPPLNPSTLDTQLDSDNPHLNPSTLDSPQLAPQPTTETSPLPSSA